MRLGPEEIKSSNLGKERNDSGSEGSRKEKNIHITSPDCRQKNEEDAVRRSKRRSKGLAEAN